MGISETQMSEMMRGHFSHLSESRLEGLLGAAFCWMSTDMAEQAGFEPAVGINPRTLSRRVT